MSTSPLTSCELREKFVISILQEDIENIKERLEEQLVAMLDDYLEKGLSMSQSKNEVIKHLEALMLMEEFKIPQNLRKQSPVQPCREKEKNYNLWDTQQKIHDMVLADDRNFVIIGAARSGKTRLLSVIAENMRVSKLKNVICTAMTTLLASQFHEGISLPNLLKTSLNSNLDAIVIDHGNLVPIYILQKLDIKLKKEFDAGQIFGGKQIIIAADFQQPLPQNGDLDITEDGSLENSHLIDSFEKLQLEDTVKFEVTELNFVKGYTSLIRETFGSMDHPQKFERRVIIAADESGADFLNEEILNKNRGPTETLFSKSTAFGLYNKPLPPNDRSYRIDCPGLDKHIIKLKPNAIIALTRDQGDYPAGTRLIYSAKFRREIGERAG